MTKIAVVLTGSQVPLPPRISLPAGVLLGVVLLTITDNSGAPAGLLDANGQPVLDPTTQKPVTVATLNGTETPPWSANFAGVTGQGEASFSAQPVDSTGANLGTAFTQTESGTGGQPGTFFQPSGGTITVS
jgi:hypothetical protein